jgi:hypothetical protein
MRYARPDASYVAFIAVMASPLVLIIFVAAADARDPSTTALVRATRDALGSSATVTVQELARTPSDGEALERARVANATVAAEIVWSSPQHLRAIVHVHLEGATRWIDRDIGFDSSDAAAERGRTLGFALASMLPERDHDDASLPAAPTAPPIPSAEPTRAGDARGVLPPATTSFALLPPAQNVSGEAPAPALAPRPWVGSVDAAAIGSVGVAGYGGGIGAAIGARWRLTPALAVRVGGGARSGDVAPAQASSLVMYGAMGLALHTSESLSRSFELGARADLLLMRLTLNHLDSDDPATVHESRWVGGADLLLEGAWFFSPYAGFFVATGVEGMTGTTDVYVAHRRTAVLPTFRAVSELGVLARF